MSLTASLVFPYPIAKVCTLDLVRCTPVEYATGPSQTVTGTVYVNGSPTSIVLTITTPAGGAVNQILTDVQDNTHTAILNPGDVVTVQWTQTNFATGSLVKMYMHMHFSE